MAKPSGHETSLNSRGLTSMLPGKGPFHGLDPPPGRKASQCLTVTLWNGSCDEERLPVSCQSSQ